MYHSLETRERPSEMTSDGDLLYVLGAGSFEQHLRFLNSEAFDVLPPSLMSGTDKLKDDDKLSVLLSFDDGHRTNHSMALPLLNKFGYKAIFFVTTGWIGKDYFMTEEMIKELSASGMVIGSHGVTHKYLTDLTPKEAYIELEKSKKTLEDTLGIPVTSLSAPGGRFDERLATLAATIGYTDIFVSDARPEFELSGLRIHGRLACKRGYGLKQFSEMLVSGAQPENPLFRKSIKLAKNMMGTKNYRIVREAVLNISGAAKKNRLRG
jgi:peptidoglycan/xylan/chitin deacetylase (PgdA/CDA1 family)